MISVIVPIYNVESYLQKCLDSLVNQTYNDVEFILVDDGSTDKSKEIADSYNGFRFRIYHTKNRGLSAARNLGIHVSHGEWIMFVDGDDWVEPHFCEVPYRVALDNKADLVIFQNYHVNKRKTVRDMKKRPYGEIDVRTAVKFGESVVWNKLYKRELFDNISFPEGRVHEDIATTYKVFLRAKKIVMIPECLYYYVNRKNSILHNRSLKYVGDGFISAYQRYNDLNLNGIKEEEHIAFLWSYALGYLLRANPSSDNVYQTAKNIVNSIPGIPRQLSIKKRLLLVLWKTNGNLFHLTCRVFRQKYDHEKQQIL